MRKLSILFFGAVVSCVAAIGGIKGMETTEAVAAPQEQIVYVGGMSAGFTLKTGGAQVIGTCEVITENGVCAPALDAGLRAGDVIYKVEGITIESIAQLNEIVNKSNGKSISVEIERGEERQTKQIQAVKDKMTGHYKIGVLIRDSVSGIGTVTYIDKESGRFGSLGHSVTGENKKEMQVCGGNVYECSIVGINKGIRGKAGELKGMFLNDKCFGTAEKLCNCGIFGQISKDFNTDGLKTAVASSADAKPGNAYIYSTVNGNLPKRYEIEIVKVDKSNKENKNYVLKIKDEALIYETGGIVQGMSGSPILQDGKLVGAITHVFLNDPTRGYGIEIGKMLQE